MVYKCSNLVLVIQSPYRSKFNKTGDLASLLLWVWEFSTHLRELVNSSRLTLESERSLSSGSFSKDTCSVGIVSSSLDTLRMRSVPYSELHYLPLSTLLQSATVNSLLLSIDRILQMRLHTFILSCSDFSEDIYLWQTDTFR